MPIPVDSLLLERRKQGYCGHQFRREPESRLSDNGFPQEVEHAVRRQSHHPGQGVNPLIHLLYAMR